MKPFVITDETKQMVVDNIVYLLKNFLTCSEYKNVIFCWVMHQESIITDILDRLSEIGFDTYKFTLTISEKALEQRVYQDIKDRIRTTDILEKSLARLNMYDQMNTVKIDVSNLTAKQAAEKIMEFLEIDL